jgi:RadC-like JAB domain
LAPLRKLRVTTDYALRTYLVVIVAAAAAVILSHNHPSGDPATSPGHRIVSEQLVAACRLLDMPVQDHVIVGHGPYLSFGGGRPSVSDYRIREISQTEMPGIGAS